MSEKHLFHVRMRTLLAGVMFAKYPNMENKSNATAAEV